MGKYKKRLVPKKRCLRGSQKSKAGGKKEILGERRKVNKKDS